MKRKIKAGSKSVKIKIRITDANSTVNSGLTGLVYNSEGLTCSYIRDNQSSPTQITLVSAAVGTYTSGGFIEVSSTLFPGVYEIGIPDTALDVGATSVHLYLFGANNMLDCPIEIELDNIDYQTSIPDQIFNTNINLYTSGNTFGSGINNIINNIYYADIELVQDTAGAVDNYGVVWFKNAIPVASGQITNPAFSVYNTMTGAALLSNRTMAYASTLVGSLFKTETTLTSSGVPYMIVASGTIDGSVRNWQNIVGKL